MLYCLSIRVLFRECIPYWVIPYRIDSSWWWEQHINIAYFQASMWAYTSHQSLRLDNICKNRLYKTVCLSLGLKCGGVGCIAASAVVAIKHAGWSGQHSSSVQPHLAMCQTTANSVKFMISLKYSSAFTSSFANDEFYIKSMRMK